MRLISFLFLLLILPIQITAQVTEEWVALHPEGYANDITVDKFGNSYIATAFSPDGLTIKYNSIGEIVWASTYNTTGNSNTLFTSIKVDSAGNVYVAGISPFTSTNNDFITIKYNSSGVEQWVRGYNGPGNGLDIIWSLAIDNIGNVYVTGTSFGAGTLDDYATIKYNSDGIEQWVRRYNASNFGDIPIDIAVDNSGNVYVTGRSYIGSTPTTANQDYATIKYNSAGVEQWVRRYNSPLNGDDMGYDLEIDNVGNIYVFGYIREPGADSDFGLVKYNSEGFEQWVKRFNGNADSTDTPSSMAIDQNNNIFVTGSSIGNGTKQDIVTIKYDSNGNEQWFRRYNNILSNSIDGSSSIAVDDSGAVYVTGGSQNNITGSDYITLKYNSAGDEEWQIGYNSPENNGDAANAIAIDDARNIYVTGYSNNGGAATIKYSQTLKLKILNPSLGIKWMSGEKDTIRWTGGQEGQFLEILFSNDGGNTYEVIDELTPADSGYFVWNKPQSLLTTKGRIKIKDLVDTTIVTESEVFRLKPYLLTRLNPDSTYYSFIKNRDQWGFSNIQIDMWPVNWYNQFDYQGIDSFTNSTYSQWQADSAFSYSNSFEHMDWVSWVNTFSIDACYHSTFLGIYKSDAVLKWYSRKSKWFGSCFGIATANALAFSYLQEFRTKYSAFPDFINPINVGSDNAVRKIINELFSYQWGNPHLAHTLSNYLTRTPNETLNDIKQMLREDNCETATLSFWNNNGSGGHNILPYSLIQDTLQSHIYYLFVYDNANPTTNNPITFNTLSNGGQGSWNTPDWVDPVSGLPWGGNFRIILMDKAINYLPLPSLPKVFESSSPFILDDDVVEIFNNQGTEIIIKNSQQEAIGFQDGEVIQNLNGGVPLIALNGSQTPPYGYSLPTDNYSVVLNNFAEDTVETFFFTGNKSFVYERSGATQTQTDRLFFDGGVSFANPDAQTKTVKILNLINETTQEKLFVARSLELAQNDSVKIENPDSNKVKLISYGSAKNYDLELNYVTENGIGRFGDFDVPLEANTSHTFVPVWTDLTSTELQVLVDVGNDGTIDDTLSLVNQVTGIGEDQGSLLSPNSYNLAQNYPNPFNPITTIQYAIPQRSNVMIKVYDVLGNEIAELVNEEKGIGVYSVNFDASNLASGIYLYKIQAGNFVETKKMILLK